MGYDLPAAIGAAIADRRRRVVCLAGDGSIMMNIQDLITIHNYNLNILVLFLKMTAISQSNKHREIFSIERQAHQAILGLCSQIFSS